jgi:hypothetical protein
LRKIAKQLVNIQKTLVTYPDHLPWSSALAEPH